MDSPDDGSYAPVSPDLSAFHAPPPAERFSPYHTRSQRRRSSLEDAEHEGSPGYRQAYEPPTLQLDDDEDFEEEDIKPRGRGRRLRKTAKAVAPAAAESVEGEVEIKTKFPVARIKRIMQADEDVGKVSQVTPVAVSKALEVFMVSLVSTAATAARKGSSKRVTAKHLKRAMAKEEEYDFLQDIISRVPDAPSPKDKHDEDADGEESKRRRGAGAKGKRKASDDWS
ncbi:MAG: hypothetical protein M1823_005111 [Watsoniomyces obsoletus]|nr:MAG: hypothetical protein M1823_005111 [Watsoniomyces obsoletus]